MLGYPGDVARGVVGVGRGATPRGSAATELYSPLQITKSAGVAKATADLLKSFEQGADAIPGYSDLLESARSASGNFRDAYNRTGQALDLTSYNAGQRGADAAATAETGRYGDTMRDILARYGTNDANYATTLRDIVGRAYGNLGQYDDAARAIGDEQLGQLTGQVSRYKIAGGNLGVGGDELRKIARGVANVELPLARDKIQRQYDIMQGMELPSERELATRESTRLTNVELPAQRDMYGNNVNDLMRGKETERQIKQLEISTANMSMSAAREFLVNQGLPARIIQEILQLKNQTEAGRVTNLSGIAGLENQAYYRGLQLNSGMNLSQPQGFDMGLPPISPRYLGGNRGGGSGGSASTGTMGFNPRDYNLPEGFQPTGREMEWLRDPNNKGRLPTARQAPQYNFYSPQPDPNAAGYTASGENFTPLGAYSNPDALRAAAADGRIPADIAYRYGLLE